MKNIKKIISCLIALEIVKIVPNLSVSAHNLGRWADYYPACNANGNDNFGIMDVYHIDGRTANYCWEKQVFTHELGHLWGIDDLYQNYTNLQSIYSDTYALMLLRDMI